MTKDILIDGFSYIIYNEKGRIASATWSEENQEFSYNAISGRVIFKLSEVTEYKLYSPI